MNRLTHLSDRDNTEGKDWRREVHVWDDYIAYWGEFLSILSRFRHRGDRHIGQVQMAKYCVELISSNKWLAHSAP